MYKKPCEKLYHVFSHGIDEWTSNLKHAVKIARLWARQYKSVRIYQETNWDSTEGLFQDEDCILSFGEFPM
jgi:hypothetical protein